MRLILRFLGHDILELTTDPYDDPTADVQGFGFAAGATVHLERCDYDDEPRED